MHIFTSPIMYYYDLTLFIDRSHRLFIKTQELI